jgi:glucose/arabinose dehydrogenase
VVAAMMRTIRKLAPWLLALAGAALIGVLAIPDLLRTGIWSMRITHAAILALGLGLLAAAYWAHAWGAGRLTSRDAPVVLLSLLVVMALPVPVLLVAKQTESNREMRLLGERIGQLEARAGRPARASFGCGPADPLQTPAVGWRPIVSGLRKPVGLTHAGDGSGRIFVIEKGGSIRVVQGAELVPDAFLDIRELVQSDDGDEPASWEEGLLGLAFSPDYRETGRFFVAYSARPDGRTIIAEYRVSADEPNRADPASARTILEFPQPAGIHNSGHLLFGPDGYLYVGVGDGGFQIDDRGDDPNQEAQRLGSIYGKILRIDVHGGDPYSVPEDNPFAGVSGARPEVYALGFRNPWRFSFDPCDGALFVGDVGRSNWEEVNLVEAGGNYGWPLMEGPECFWRHRGCRRDGFILPIFSYPHMNRDPRGGASVIGGHVYRGSLFPTLAGSYFLADFISGHLFSLAHDPGNPGNWIVGDLARLGFRISSFGEDEERELYLVDYEGRIFQLTAAD